MNDTITVRFAPSPTGYLHVGGARTAIFNWLYARSAGGRFLLRIEDTDRNRSSDDMTRAILDGLAWLGVDADADPVMQSDNVGRHRAECLRLLAEDKAYWCFCTAEELDAKRAAAEAAGGAFLYDGTCRHLTAEQRAAHEAAGKTKVLRIRVPEGTTRFADLVHDETAFDNAELDDFILLRSDGSPVYMVAVVVDDHDMGVTHVLRGDDHLSNTPKQIVLYQAFGYETPVFGHMPLILGTDRKRLSKRHGATAVGEYRTRGYLPEALFNFLALLGWSPGDDREVMTREELAAAFDVRRLLKAGAVFDEDKLRWMNGMHLRRLTPDEVLKRAMPHAPSDLPRRDDRAFLLRVTALMQERMTLLPDLFTAGRYFFEYPADYDEAGTAKHWKDPAPGLLRALAEELAACDFTAGTLETLIRGRAEAAGLGAGKLIHPLRLALTGATASPSLFDMMEVLGRDTCLRRLARALERLGG